MPSVIRSWVCALVLVCFVGFLPCSLIKGPFPSQGGTYLTLLNTLSNLGRAWSVPIVMYCIDVAGFVPVNVLWLLCGLVYASAIRDMLVRLETLPLGAWSPNGRCVV